MNSRKKGKRKLKANGYRHEDNKCPAQLILKKTTQGSFELTYYKTHVGHSKDKSHLNIPKIVYQTVSKLLNNQVDRSSIIEKIKDKFDIELNSKHIRYIAIKFKSHLENKFDTDDCSDDMFVDDFLGFEQTMESEDECSVTYHEVSGENMFNEQDVNEFATHDSLNESDGPKLIEKLKRKLNDLIDDLKKPDVKMDHAKYEKFNKLLNEQKTIVMSSR